MGIRSTVFFWAYFLTWQFSVGALKAQPVVMGYSGTGVSGTLRRVIEKEKLWQKRGLDVKLFILAAGE